MRRQERPALHQNQMQADAQTRQPARARDRVLCRGGGDHEAGSRQDAALMRGFHGFIDFAREPKIVGGDDDTFQSAGSRRSRRKRKNSTPSRSRRFNHVGASHHFAGDGGDLRRAEIEAPVERVHRLENLGVAQMRIAQGGELDAAVAQHVRVLRWANQWFSCACL